jgi:hypothetical protein
MGMEANPTGVDTQVQVAPLATQTTPEKVTPELAESLPFDELKRRMRAEANSAESTTTPDTQADDQGAQQTAEDVNSEAVAGTEPGAKQATDAQAATTPEAQAQRGKQPATLEEALRVIEAVRGNLSTNINERNAAQQRIQALEADMEAMRQQAAQNAMQSQHARFEELVARLPQEQQGLARAEYMQRLQQQAMGDYANELRQKETQIQVAEFRQAKAELPAMYKDIARFVAEQQGIDAATLVELVDSPQVKSLIDAAQNPQAVQQATVAFGQLLDWVGMKEAQRITSEKEARRQAKAGTQVRDMPTGMSAGGAQEDVVNKINNMDKKAFEDYKKKLLKAAQQ